MEEDPYGKQDPERPGEYAWQMPADYMLPQMLFDEMVGCEKQGTEHDKAQGSEKPVHPFLTKEVEAVGVRSFFLKQAGDKCCDEDKDSYEHYNSLPEGMAMSGLIMMGLMGAVIFMDLIGVFKPCRQRPAPLPDPVGNKAGHNCKREQDKEKP